MGRMIDEKKLTVFQINKATKSITEEKLTVTGHLILLIDICTKLLHKHVELGLVRCSDFKLQTASDEELAAYFYKAKAHTHPEMDREQM